jgi:hypothetical protein
MSLYRLFLDELLRLVLTRIKGPSIERKGDATTGNAEIFRF